MPPILTLEQISKRFGAVVVAESASTSRSRGEALGIIGPNGAGKTTLFGIITGTVPPQSRPRDVRRPRRHPPESRRSGAAAWGIARSFQIPQPFGGMTVFENLVVAAAFGGGRREREVYDGCAGLLERCGLAERPTAAPAALTLLDRKRLELARALATGPRVLLLDEVAGGLIEHETAALVDLITTCAPPASRSSGSSTSSMR